MSSRLAFEERQHFSHRLQEQLRKAGVTVRASVVASEFNLRADGATVTTYAARKWLMGEAIPTHERMLILANWLGVHASWLQYGDAENDQLKLATDTEQLSTPDLILLRDYQSLSQDGQKIIREVLSVLMKTLPKKDSLRTNEAAVD